MTAVGRWEVILLKGQWECGEAGGGGGGGPGAEWGADEIFGKPRDKVQGALADDVDDHQHEHRDAAPEGKDVQQAVSPHCSHQLVGPASKPTSVF
jgi:hypothetical protein